MNPLLFFLLNFACFSSLLILDAYGFEKETYKLAEYLVAFFAGMLVAEMIL